MNLYFTVFTLHSLCQYIVVFFGYFWLSRLKPKKNHKKQISNLKNHCFFHPCFPCFVTVADSQFLFVSFCTIYRLAKSRSFSRYLVVLTAVLKLHHVIRYYSSQFGGVKQRAAVRRTPQFKHYGKGRDRVTWHAWCTVTAMHHGTGSLTASFCRTQLWSLFRSGQHQCSLAPIF